MAVTITIDGSDRTGSVIVGSFRKTDNLNQQVDTCNFKINKYGASVTYVPSVGEEVVVTKGATIIFGGVIARIREKVEASTVLIYEIECVDYSQYLKRRLVTERYEGMTVAAIIADIIANYTTDSFTTVNASSTLVIESVSFNRISVADCLQKLADAISYVWYVDYDKDIHFFPRNTEHAPFNLSDTAGNHIYNSLEIVEDLTQVRNSITVQGGDAESDSARTEYASGDGTRTQFPLVNKFSEKPIVTVSGSPQAVGVEFLDDDAAFDVMWNYNEKYLRFTAGNTPGAGTNNIEATAKYLYPIVVSVPAPASQAVYGTYQFAITDRTIGSQAEAIARAQAELTSYAQSLHEGSFRTYSDGLRSGQVIGIQSTQRGKDIDVLIQSVSATMRDPEGEHFEYSVRFATLKSIGIIAYLQNQLRSKEVIVDDDEILLTYYPLEDEIGFADELSVPVTSAGPYVWTYLHNADFKNQPAFTAATSTFDRWIDGTSGGSTTDDRFGWATARTGSGYLDAQFDSIGERTCIKMAGSGMNKSGGSTGFVTVCQIRAYTGPTLSLSLLDGAVPVTPGLTYNLSGDCWVESVSDPSEVRADISAVWYNAAGSRVGSVSVAASSYLLAEWQSLAASIVAPAGAAYLVIRCTIIPVTDGTNRAATAYFANLELVQPGETTLRWGYGTWG